MQVTLEQARDIINAHDGNKTAHISSFSEVKSTGYSYTASWKLYHITLSDSDESYLLVVSSLVPNDLPPGRTTPPRPITLPTLSILLTKILNGTTVPVPRPVAHDVEGNWPFGWLLLRVPGPSQPHPPISLTSVRETLSEGQIARIQQQLGGYLRALHGITNDSFGVPVDKPPEPPSVPSFAELFAASQTGEEGEGYGEDMIPYSWQDTFVLRLEELLDYVCGDAETRQAAPSGSLVQVDVDALRRSLTRAIGAFLFDDVETPSLTWVTGNEEDVIMSLKDSKQGSGGTTFEEADIAYILPTFAHALWGDPLLEALFLPPGPTGAMNKGYFGEEEDGTLFLFPRHKTKRAWYTLYLALIILAEMSPEGEAMQKVEEETVRWAKSILPECIEILKDAPC